MRLWRCGLNVIRPMRFFGAEGDGDEGGAPKPDPKPAEPKPEPKTFDEKYVRELRDEAAGHRKAKKDAEDELATLKAEADERVKAEMTELEQAKTTAEEATELAARNTALLRQANIENVVMRIASELEFVDPLDAQAMLVLDDLDLDKDTGRPTDASVRKQLKKLIEAKPYLLKTPGAGDGDGSPKPPGGGGELTGDEAWQERVKEHTKDMTEAGGRVPIPQ